MKKLVPVLFACIWLFSACSPRTATLIVMTHDSFSASEEVIRNFEEANHVDVVFLASGDSGTALNKAILNKNAPFADVFFGVDNTYLSRALDEGIFQKYNSPLLALIPDEYELDPEYSALPVDLGDVCINYDIAWFSTHDLPVPDALEDLLMPEYNNLLVVENPATSSPGLAFLLATIAEFGEDGYLDYWAALRDNGVEVVNSWEAAYYTNFSGSSGRGLQPMVVSYYSSPAAEFIFADPPVTSPPTAAITNPGTCFRQIEFVGILTGTPNRALAEKFIDYILDIQFQEDIPLQKFMNPVNLQAELPPEFLAWAKPAESPASIAPTVIASSREEWIDAWTEVVIR